MSKKITNSDYKNILTYYNIPIPKSTTILKNKANEILAEKLLAGFSFGSASGERKGNNRKVMVQK